MCVGMPMPRFTYWPSSSSIATRAASCSLVSAMSCLPYGAAFDPLLGAVHGDDALHEHPGCVHECRVQLAGLDQLLDLGDRDAAGGGAEGVEVARGHPVDEVAVPVALPGADQREVRDDRLL